MTKIILKWAQTADGFLDHDGESRLIISSPEDWDEVAKLRSECDMILVGANTIRRDNPSLRLNEEYVNKSTLMRAVLSSSGDLDVNSRIFDGDDGVRRIIFVTDKSRDLSALKNKGVDIVKISKRQPAADIYTWCSENGFNKVLVEGGHKVHNTFMAENIYDEIRIATGPMKVGSHGTVKAPQIDPGKLSLSKAGYYGNTKVSRYLKI